MLVQINSRCNSCTTGLPAGTRTGRRADGSWKAYANRFHFTNNQTVTCYFYNFVLKVGMNLAVGEYYGLSNVLVSLCYCLLLLGKAKFPQSIYVPVWVNV